MNQIQKTVLVIGLVVWLTSLCNAQQKTRTVVKSVTTQNEPIRVERVATGSKIFNQYNQIEAERGWLRDLVLSVRNISDKSIVYIKIHLRVAKQGDMRAQMLIPMHFGRIPMPRIPDRTDSGRTGNDGETPLLKPGETTSLRISKQIGHTVEKQLYDQGVDVQHLEFVYDFVAFEDGLAWSQGMKMRQDPENPLNWVVIAEGEANINPRRSIRNGGKSTIFTSFTGGLDSFFLQSPRRENFSIPRPFTTEGGEAPCVYKNGINFESCGQGFFCNRVVYCTVQVDRLSTTPIANQSAGISVESQYFCDPPGTLYGPECEWCNPPNYYYGPAWQVGSCSTPTPTPTPTPPPPPPPGECDSCTHHPESCSMPRPGGGDAGVSDGDGEGDGGESEFCCPPEQMIHCLDAGGTWYPNDCQCISPIAVDVLGNGFNLTNEQNGVLFDIVNRGMPMQVSWTSAGSDDAWLALDRNGNGLIDSGRELFGSAAPQPYLQAGETKNGFRALANFDRLDRGGNGDGKIDAQDAIFPDLRLWQDVDHNGVSEPGELHTLPELGLVSIDLDYKESRRVDQHGNWFRFRSKVKDAQGHQLGRWAWDVFLRASP